MDNYETLDTGVIKQIKVEKIPYNFEYSNKYNDYGEKSNYLSYLRFGVLIAVLNKIPDSIVDIGYGNGDFLRVCKNANIKNVYGCDISDYPVPNGCIKIDISEIKNSDVVCFFDSLEHFDDINVIKNMETEYIFISVPYCHNYNDKWFLKWYHRRPNEHLWHFNDKSLIETFKNNGYECIYTSNFEDIIRKNESSKNYPNILSCVFKKVNNIDLELNNFYNDKIIIVTGGTGFIGRNIVTKLLKYNIKKLYVFDRTLKCFWDDERVNYIKGNICTDIYKLDDIQYDIMFHEASNNDIYSEDESIILDTNYYSSLKLLDLCNKMGAKFIYASSIECSNSSLRLNEVPDNLYVKSKYLIDKYIIENGDKIKIPIISLRYYNVYGFGEEHKDKMMSIVSKIIKNMKANIDLNVCSLEEKHREFVYIDDVVNCNILAGLKSGISIYDCGYPESVSIEYILDILRTYYCTDSKIIYNKKKSDISEPYNITNLDKTRKELKYVPRYNIIKGIYSHVKKL